MTTQHPSWWPSEPIGPPSAAREATTPPSPPIPKTGPPSDKMLSSEDVAEHLGVPRRTIDDWRQRNLGPAYVKVGKHVRYRRADIDAWLKANTQTPGAQARTAR